MCKGFNALQTMKSFNFVRPLILNYTSFKFTKNVVTKTNISKLSSSCDKKYTHPITIHLFKVNNSNTRRKCELCSKLTIKTPERCCGVFIVNFEQISHFY